MKLNKYWEGFCCYVLAVSTTLKKVFSRCNFGDNYVQVPSSCIPTCSHCIYYCSLPPSSASPSSLLKVPIIYSPCKIYTDALPRELGTSPWMILWCSSIVIARGSGQLALNINIWILIKNRLNIYLFLSPFIGLSSLLEGSIQLPFRYTSYYNKNVNLKSKFFSFMFIKWRADLCIFRQISVWFVRPKRNIIQINVLKSRNYRE